MQYAAYGRINNGTPSLKCNNDDIIKVRVGLITVDEAIFGGLPWAESTTKNYLYNNQNYWTMSPMVFGTFHEAEMFVVWMNGSLYDDGSSNVQKEYGTRPVINLSADVTLTGSGTMDDPYVVEGAE